MMIDCVQFSFIDNGKSQIRDPGSSCEMSEILVRRRHNEWVSTVCPPSITFTPDLPEET